MPPPPVRHHGHQQIWRRPCFCNLRSHFPFQFNIPRQKLITMSTPHKVKLHELALALGKTGTHNELKKKVKQAQKHQSVLPVALPKIQEEKIQRQIAYNAVKSQVSVWDDVVRSNRLAEKIYFPLQQPNIIVKSAIEAARTFKPKTPLELEIAAILKKSDHVLRDNKKLTEAEEEAIRAMSIEEAQERRRNLQKARALQSYMEAKARRRKKIKSKQYHRLLKKDKIKKQEKELEELQLKDPKAALEKLEEIDKNRIQERMSLKHRNSGKWSKYMMVRAKRDISARESLAEQLKISKKLTEKRKKSDDEEEEEVEKGENEGDKVVGSAFEEEDSPWLVGKDKGEKKGLEMIEEVKKVGDYREVWQETRDKVEKKKKTVRFEEKVKNSAETKAERVLKAMVKEKKKEIKSKRKLKKKKKIIKKKISDEDVVENENVDVILNETIGKNGDEEEEENGVVNKIVIDKKKSNDSVVDIIEVDFDKIKRKMFIKPQILKSNVPKMILDGDDEEEENGDDDDEDDQRMTLAEAFADDDVTREFNEEKEAIVKANEPKSIDLFLPGWGSWSGTGIKENKRKKQRYLIEPPTKVPRKDEKLPNVIINENADEQMKKLQVQELPYPFKTIKEFEKSISAPVGHTWNAESAFRRVIAPRIETKLGAIVEPIDKNALSIKRENPLNWKVGDRPVNFNKKVPKEIKE